MRDPRLRDLHVVRVLRRHPVDAGEDLLVGEVAAEGGTVAGGRGGRGPGCKDVKSSCCCFCLVSLCVAAVKAVAAAVVVVLVVVVVVAVVVAVATAVAAAAAAAAQLRVFL